MSDGVPILIAELGGDAQKPGDLGAKATERGQQAASPRWILIADDDDLVRALWAETLGGAGYRTIEARSGRVALDLIAAVVPDLIILDLCLPDLSGDEVLQYLRGSALLRSTPVVVVSGFLDSEPHDGFGLNIVGLLPKPIGLARLLDAVAGALKVGASPRLTRNE
jgi:CheY-like chemotaxis protein